MPGPGNAVVVARGTITLGDLEAAAAAADSQFAALPGRASALPASKASSAAAPVAAPPQRPPPEWAMRRLAGWLGAETGLTAFNFDVIVPSEQQDTAAAGAAAACSPLRVHVVDVNYFPGFDKAGGGAQAMLGEYLAARAIEARRRRQ